MYIVLTYSTYKREKTSLNLGQLQRPVFWSRSPFWDSNYKPCWTPICFYSWGCGSQTSSFFLTPKSKEQLSSFLHETYFPSEQKAEEAIKANQWAIFVLGEQFAFWESLSDTHWRGGTESYLDKTSLWWEITTPFLTGASLGALLCPRSWEMVILGPGKQARCKDGESLALRLEPHSRHPKLERIKKTYFKGDTTQALVFLQCTQLGISGTIWLTGQF